MSTVNDPVNAPAPAAPVLSWKILVVDDEPAIHQVTKLALRNTEIFGRPLSLISALSAQGAREQLAKHDDIAVILLDVVMESEQAGLELVRHVREELKNTTVRIVLRTGQPGQAPERRVMIDYDINDYKEKTDLTANKLFTTLAASIRAYRDTQALECSVRGLQAVASLNQSLFNAKSLDDLGESLVEAFDVMKLFSGLGFATPGHGWTLGHCRGQTPVLDVALCEQTLGTADGLTWQGDQLAIAVVTTVAPVGVLLLHAALPLSPYAHDVVALLCQSMRSALRHVTAQS